MRRVAPLLLRALDDMLAPEVEPGPRPIGILFVHGIGSQGQSATVREFSAPLLDYLRKWHKARGHPGWQPDSAELSYGDTLTGPARVDMRWPAFERGESSWEARRFIFTEAWWASRLDAPSLEVMVVWSGRVLLGVIRTLWRQISGRVGFLLRGGGTSRSDPGKIAAVVEIVSGFVFMLAYVVAAIAGYAVLIPLFLLARIPIQEVQDFILLKLLKPLLVDNIGDFESYVHDEVQALNIRTAVGDTIRYLVKAGCEDVCVIAHSQGALVAFDAVCALGQQDPDTAHHVRKLITLGGSLNRAFTQHDLPPRLKQTLPSHVFWLDIWAQYDPVAGGYLNRSTVETPLVAPTAEVRDAMHWHTPGNRPMPDQVTNGMNPLVDHGGYFHNPEQFTNRVLAEIDSPRAYYKTSRFFFPDPDPAASTTGTPESVGTQTSPELASVEADPERVRRRRTRVSTLALWRLIAIGAFVVALVLRGRTRLAADGRALSEQLEKAPLHELLTAPAKFFDGVGSVLDALGRALEGVGILSPAIVWLRGAWASVPWGDLILASALVASVFAGVYLALRWVLYRPWDEDEAEDAIEETLSSGSLRGLLIWLRTGAFVGAFIFAVRAVLDL